MKSFGEWLHSDPTKGGSISQERPAATAEKQSLKYELGILRQIVIDNDPNLHWNEKTGYAFRCQSCEQWRDLEDIAEYNPDYRFCGGSPRCCP